MPNKIQLSELEPQFPSFVKIIPETYRGVRYTAQFLDTDYDELFFANPKSVINLQHGCKTRSNEMRSATISKKFMGTNPKNRAIPIEDVKEQLPPFLTINESTYKGIRHKAEFYDTEYKITFESIVANMIRGKGYCAEREKVEFLKQVTIPPEDIQNRIQEIYNGRVELIEHSYVNTNTLCQWLVDKKRVITKLPTILLQGKLFTRKYLEEWRCRVLVRDNFTCIRCQSKDDLCSHHIVPWVKNEALRFVVDNGATLCADCHNLYHSIFHRVETPDNFKEFLEKD